MSIPYKATVDLQKKELTLSDVYGIWLKSQLHLDACIKLKKNYKTDLAKHLLNAINERKETVFKNPLMTAALFLDPRFRRQVLRDVNKTEEAMQTLKNIWRRLIALNDAPNVPVAMNISDKSVDSNVSLDFDAQAELDKYLSIGNGIVIETAHETAHEIDIEHLLDIFNPDAISSEKSVLKYWEEAKEHNPQLYELAMVVFAVPPTEVQIERDFSKLNFIFTDRRCSLTEERLNDIMLIHLNDEIFHHVKQEELNSLGKC